MFGIELEQAQWFNLEQLSQVHSSSQAKRLLTSASSNRKTVTLRQQIKLGDVVFGPDCLNQVVTTFGRGNFFGEQLTKGSPAVAPTSAEDLTGRIICLERADPGYDWIFQHKIGGLLTRFGGANSHMALRCVELGLTAALGVSERVFRDAQNANELTIDPQRTRVFAH